MKIRVKVAYSCLTLSKKPPPPFSKSWLRACTAGSRALTVSQNINNAFGKTEPISTQNAKFDYFSIMISRIKNKGNWSRNNLRL